MSAQAPSVLYQLDGFATGDQLGQAVGSVGDVNQDGFDDFVIGSPLADDSGVDGGSVRVFSGFDGSVLHYWTGARGGSWFGASVNGAGDVNGDGVPDVIVGAPLDDADSLMDSGTAWVFSGVDGSLLHQWSGDGTGDEFGTSVGGAGDINGDGYADLIVGAPWDDNFHSDSGSARVFSGSDGSVLYAVDGDSWDDHFGQSVSGAGDVNNDGRDDFMVGAPWDDVMFSKSGSAFVFSGMDGSILHAFNGDGLGHELGWAVAYAGDVNGDGYAEIWVGQPEDRTNGNDSGSARLLSGLDGSILHTWYGTGAFEYFGYSISAGDVDGDGVTDLIVGAFNDDVTRTNAGAAYVFSGANYEMILVARGDGQIDQLGRSVSLAGDVNGDGFVDVIAGIPGSDRGGVDSGSATVFRGQPSQASVSTFGTGCPSSQPLMLKYSGVSRFGQTLNVNVVNGPMGNTLCWILFGLDAGDPFPVDLGFAGLVGCAQYHSADAVVAVTMTGGSATLSLSVPAAIAPSGAILFNQAAMFDSAAPGGVSVSNAGRVVFWY